MWKTGQDSCIAFLCLARVQKAKTGSLSPAEFSNSKKQNALEYGLDIQGRMYFLFQVCKGHFLREKEKSKICVYKKKNRWVRISEEIE
jgi:uncharacterized pyridoxamine 5'-phosphate oxidase family protein